MFINILFVIDVFVGQAGACPDVALDLSARSLDGHVSPVSDILRGMFKFLCVTIIIVVL